jgi:transposase
LFSLKKLLWGADKVCIKSTGTTQPLEIRRRVAMTLLDGGWSIRQVARQIKAAPGSVCRWRDTRAQHGEAGLTAKRHSGSKPQLTAAQRQQWLGLLSQGARAHGWPNALWTLKRLTALIARRFGLSYCPSGLWRLLRRCQWSPQKPERRARERAEQAMAQWPVPPWPQLKKSPA